MIEELLPEAIAGTTLEGTIALSDEIINAGLGDALGRLLAPAAPPAPATAPRPIDEKGPTRPDPEAFLAALDVRELTYRTEKDRTLLKISASIGKTVPIV